MTDPIVEAVDVVKLVGNGAAQVQALKGVSLALKRGELTLLMGPSGSGKTTLLSILGCILTPTRGTVRIRGRSTVDAGPEELAKLRRDHVGFIFQSYHLFPTLTAADNVRLALDVRGDKSARAIAKTKDALAMVGLSHKMNAFPLELSGGEQQRVAIARAIVGQLSAILANEPTASLDGENGNAIMTLLAGIATLARSVGRRTRPAYIALRRPSGSHRTWMHRPRSAPRCAARKRRRPLRNP
jgi:putative ABC transport system ATP-binding protein